LRFFFKHDVGGIFVLGAAKFLHKPGFPDLTRPMKKHGLFISPVFPVNQLLYSQPCHYAPKSSLSLIVCYREEKRKVFATFSLKKVADLHIIR
jgi:hypothetical protein